MDPELERYLSAVVVLLSLVVGLLGTLLWSGAESVSVTFLLVPPAVGAVLAGGLAWGIAGLEW